jgi:tetratricopeptide (TPR) repeat protein
MALRLTSSTLAATEPESGIDGRKADATAAAVIAGRGAAAIQARNWADYQQQFADATELSDPSRRYQAQRALLEHAFTAAAGRGGNELTEVLVALASGALSVLEETPAEPIVLNYAGVALYELWSLDAARALFKAAQRLDPDVPFLRRNLRECARRRRAGGRPRRALHPAIPALGRRAQAVAAKARPAQGLRLSLCMIVRDEEEMLGRCLEAVAPAVDEIVIVDTGSVDGTIEIARSFGARVIEREWTGSFSDARNVSFDAATGDWLLYLDADEVLVAEDVDRLRALRGHTWREAFYFTETNFTGEEDTGTALTHSALRMFRNRPSYRFSGRLHEQIANTLPAYIPERLVQTGVRIEHYGYLGAVRDAKEKSRRNIELLRAQMAESQASPFLHFNLGSEYFATGDAGAALAEYERAWQMMLAEPDSSYEFTPTLVSRTVKAMRVCGRTEEALARAADGLERFPGFTDLVYEQGAAYLDLRRREDAFERFERCIAMGDAPARYTALVGCGTYLPRLTMAEVHLRDGEVDAALPLLRWCIEHHPTFIGIVLPYASALLRSGVQADAVVTEFEERLPQLTPSVRFMLGTALFEAGAAEVAERQFRAVLERQPLSGTARVALAEVLLYQRRYGEAALAAGELDEADAFAPMASRSELFGLLAAGELDAVPAALDRATRTGLDPAERALFASWHARALGRTEAQATGLDAIPLLATMLEALLRVQDFDTFETVHKLLADSELPGREQRELLGQMYLRRGFLKSAAREWMAVCEEAPDLRALIGLAQVSKAHGLPEAAHTFAQQALAIEPENPAARALADATREPVAA